MREPSSNRQQLTETMSRSAIVLAFTLLLFPTHSAFAEVVITSNTEYYEVTGRKPKDILESMGQNFGAFTDQDKTVASAHPKFNVSYSWQPDNHGCRVKKVTVNIHTTFRYPRLIESDLSRGTKQWWDMIFLRLEQHELIHELIAIKYANKIQNKLQGKYFGCKSLEKKVQMFLGRIVREMNGKQLGYDSQTNHGIAQQNFNGLSKIPYVY